MSISDAFSDIFPTKTVVVGPLFSSSLARRAARSLFGTGGLLTTGTDETITAEVGAMMPMWTGIIGVPALKLKKINQTDTMNSSIHIFLFSSVASLQWNIKRGAYLRENRHTEGADQEGATAAGLNEEGRTFRVWMWPNVNRINSISSLCKNENNYINPINC